MSDHDQRLKTLLKEFFADFFQVFLTDWVDYFDFSQIEWLDQEVFPDPPDGRRRVIDLAAKLRTKKPVAADTKEPADWIALVHVEIESSESVAPLRRRMHRYHTHLRDQHNLPVLPVAVYLKVGLDGIGRDSYEEWFGPLRVLHFEYLYVGLPALDAVEYLKRGNDLAAALSALMKVDEERKPWLKAESLLRVARSEQNEQNRFLLGECVQTYLLLDDAGQEAEFERLINEQNEFGEVRIMAATWHEKGLQQGLQQGLQRERALIFSLLEERFGVLSDSVRRRVENWPPDELTDLGRRLIKAETLAELGLED